LRDPNKSRMVKGDVHNGGAKPLLETATAVAKSPPRPSRSLHWMVHMGYLLLLSILLVLFQAREMLASEVVLQGAWHFTDDLYVVIDGKRLQILFLAEDGSYKVLHEDPAICLQYHVVVPMYSYRYTLVRSTSSCIDLGTTKHPFNAKRLRIKIYPSYGVMRVMEDGEVVSELIKDNQMSLELFRSC